ncbi:MAG: hypothetical protein LBF66_01005 [Holosporales bacterium]|nr:hypothetical protein [Holosporales bacterium]
MCCLGEGACFRAKYILIPSDSSGFIEVKSIVKLRKSTRRVSREPYSSPTNSRQIFVLFRRQH